MGIGTLRRAREQQGAISQEVAPSAMEAQPQQQEPPKRKRTARQPKAQQQDAD